MTAEPLLAVNNLSKRYGGHGRMPFIDAVKDVSFSVAHGEVFGLVGESGSGKSTLGRMVLRLEPASGGRIHFDGRDITDVGRRHMQPIRKHMQAVFQDPYASLSPRMRVGRFVAEALEVHGLATPREWPDHVAELFRRVGLDPSLYMRFPHELSGGQRQRISIARAIASQPRFIVADEPITALDVSVQAQIINLFRKLQDEMGLAYLFIAHDLGMVRYLCQRVAVMWGGRLVEMGLTEQVFENPLHSYTRSLLAAMPVPDPDVEAHRRHVVRDSGLDTDGDAMVEEAPGHWVLR